MDEFTAVELSESETNKYSLNSIVIRPYLSIDVIFAKIIEELNISYTGTKG